VDDKALRAESQPGETLDFGILPELIGYHVRRAQLYLFADFARTMADAQITPGQFGVLSLVAANPGLTQSALARAVRIERSTMVAVIDALQGRGLVERSLGRSREQRTDLPQHPGRLPPFPGRGRLPPTMTGRVVW